MNERKNCPRCQTRMPMNFIFPTPQTDPEVESVIGNLQRCLLCGWEGSVDGFVKFDLVRHDRTYYLDGKRYTSLHAVLVALGLLVD